MNNNVLGTYFNGNYNVTIYEDGTKIRENNLDNLTPSFAESCDCTITYRCDNNCDFCYMGCTPNGKHADLLSDVNINFINTLHPYTELALNGNDLSHPQLIDFLKLLNEKNIIANITVNQRHFMEHYDYIKTMINDKLIYGLGISLVNSQNIDFINKAKTIPNAVIHTICGVTTIEDYETILNNNLKVLILGYKTLSRGVSYKTNNSFRVTVLTQLLKDFIKVTLHGRHRKLLISFDNLAIEQLEIKKMLTDEEWNSFYMGDDGKYTFYIDLVNRTFSSSSISNIKYNMDNLSVDEMFNTIKKEGN